MSQEPKSRIRYFFTATKELFVLVALLLLTFLGGYIRGGNNVTLPYISNFLSDTSRALKGDSDLALGNPSDATANPSNSDNYLMVRKQYALSYNSHCKTPNWVSWQLDKDWLGDQQRRSAFAPDESLPPGFEKAQPEEYTRSGYDRGHICPSGDRTASAEDNSATFLMTNIAPQTADSNRGPWMRLQSFCRELAREGKELYVIAGVQGSQNKIGNGVNVPETWWKVVVVLPVKGMDASDVTSNTELICVELPNTTGIRDVDWHSYVTSLRSVERLTGYHFLSKVPKETKAALLDKIYVEQD